MQRAVRSSVTAGVALLGVGVIAASPIAPPVPDIHLPAIHVDATTLAAAVSPIDTYKQVFETAAANFQALVDSADPGVVLKQIAANQVASLTGLGTALGTAGSELFTALTTTSPELVKTVFTSLAAGNVEAATNALLLAPLVLAQPIINLLPAIQQFVTQPVQNLINVAHIFNDPVYDSMVAVGLLGPVINALGATGTAMQNVIDAARAGDPQQVVNALLTGPATIINGVLNGGYGPDLGGLIPGGLTVIAGGLFTKSGLVFDPNTGAITINVGGPIDTLQTLAKQIANALKPPAAVSAAAVHTKALTPKADEDTAATPSATPKAAAKPVRHAPAATSTAKGGNDKGNSATGPKHPHKAEGRGHSAR
ncbi:conserved exported hypothetical protein [uncultured Mycobacterium sp.]|uniref:PE-PGRS family protein n=1 Tax=uncultured Mycobacterium sp. TaxID=171292 RepID=A0A1Y5PGL0_9MYCO|nr:conserved exported hypothetical protein [uncultured Mycobacterium sp.]SBS76449.1 conserved exported hypothetical protein [uncultured Mycobacterium sp.]